jgi:hypothetical protein
LRKLRLLEAAQEQIPPPSSLRVIVSLPQALLYR